MNRPNHILWIYSEGILLPTNRQISQFNRHSFIADEQTDTFKIQTQKYVVDGHTIKHYTILRRQTDRHTMNLVREL